MTRINIGIDPTELSNKHLLAEHRELKRIPNVVKSGRFNMVGQPSKFVLGTGHVKFFYDKLGYLKTRYKSLHNECKKRGFNVSDFSDCFENLPSHLMKDYTPTIIDRSIVMVRINERLSGMGLPSMEEIKVNRRTIKGYNV